MNFNNKIYRSQSFVNKIQMNLANISSNPEDEFLLVNAYYDPHFFDCQLCDHKGCAYAYEVKNLKTEQILKVGSECIHHFKDKGVNIDLAEALMKRVMSATNKARRDLKDKLGNEAWEKLTDAERKEIGYKRYAWREEAGKLAYKNLSDEDKRELIVNQFMIIQAKELLTQVAYNKHYLSEEELKKIADLGLDQELAKAEKQRAAQQAQERKVVVAKEASAYISSLKLTWAEVDTEKTDTLSKEFDSLKGSWEYNPIPGMVSNYMRDKTYHMSQPVENNEFEIAIKTLIAQDPTNYFFSSVYSYYKKYGKVTEKQREAIMKSVKK